ncbi:carbohydrate-binding protein [Flavobacterium sp. Sd200]|uniref:carbohydrate-binding protein n=1 Tax=Flavobacterium sp. Sd200 TaxID=2692211 RepID=UPI00136D568F|nr:carbohydrate-binding protein [Flavobacterium sp. Sd200]MXN90601.1 carbohydrate-binding protein [Flavobacterium sp. Sd200]
MTFKNYSFLKYLSLISLFTVLILSCSDDDVRTVTLYSKGATEAEASSTNIRFGESVDFTSTSRKALTLNWTFAGGNPSTSINPNVTVAYAAPGTYEAKLVVKYIDNTVETKTFSIVVRGIDAPLPYGGTAATIAGVIEAENYDLGGEGVAYHDNEEDNLAVNNGSATYREDDGVDIQVATDATAITNTNAGEWVNYTVNATVEGTYAFEFMVASGAATGGKSIRLQLMNQSTGATTNLGETGNFANTGGWDVYTGKTVSGIVLPAGSNTIRVFFTGGDTNLDKINVTETVPAGPIEGLGVFTERAITNTNRGETPVNNGSFVITTVSEAYEGSRAYLYHYDPVNSGNTGNGFALSIMAPATSPLNASAYGFYNIALKTSTTKNLRLRMNTSAGNYWITLNSTTDATYGMARDGAWHALKIPVADFKLNGNGAAITSNLDKITGVLVMRTDDADYATYSTTAGAFDWYVDDIYFSVE